MGKGDESIVKCGNMKQTSLKSVLFWKADILKELNMQIKLVLLALLWAASPAWEVGANKDN